jgi:hypothetical protein
MKATKVELSNSDKVTHHYKAMENGRFKYLGLGSHSAGHGYFLLNPSPPIGSL